MPALVGWLALGATSVAAQTKQDSLRAAHDCAAAIRIVHHGHPDKKEAWAWARLMGCGAAGGQAAGDIWRSQRLEGDTTALKAVLRRLWSLRDVSLFDAAMSVAGDASATPQSRVYSAIMLLGQLTENGTANYEYFSTPGEFDVCRVDHIYDEHKGLGAPLPSNARERAHGLARSLEANASAPSEVRSAGRCLEQILTRDERARAKMPSQAPPPA